MGKWLLFFLKFFLHQNHMIVNIIKLYGLPEKIIIRTQVRCLVYFFF